MYTWAGVWNLQLEGIFLKRTVGRIYGAVGGNLKHLCSKCTVCPKLWEPFINVFSMVECSKEYGIVFDKYSDTICKLPQKQYVLKVEKKE